MFKSSKSKKTILIVDDMPLNIELLSEMLKEKYFIKTASCGEEALDSINKQPPDLILLDIMMPVIGGYEVCRRIKRNKRTNKIPVIFVSALSEPNDEALGLELGADDYIVKPIRPAPLLARVRTQLKLADYNNELEYQVKERTRELFDSRLEIIHNLGRAAEFKDNETGQHVVRMSYYSRLIAESMSGDAKWIETIYHAAPMHDIGKIGIPDHILIKPGKLTDSEWEIMKQHPKIGAEIIDNRQSDLLKASTAIALTHHEKWDGSGYPYGLKEKDIPLAGRIVAIADVYDALRSKRPYKEAWSVEKAKEYITSQAGKHFDPELIFHFLEVHKEIEKIGRLHKDL